MHASHHTLTRKHTALNGLSPLLLLSSYSTSTIRTVPRANRSFLSSCALNHRPIRMKQIAAIDFEREKKDGEIKFWTIYYSSNEPKLGSSVVGPSVRPSVLSTLAWMAAVGSRSLPAASLPTYLPPLYPISMRDSRCLFFLQYCTNPPNERGVDRAKGYYQEYYC